MSKVTGLDQVLRRLKKETDKIPGKTLKGLIRSAIIVRRDMEKTPPLIPVNFGNLRSSFFLVTSEGDVSDPGGTFKGPDAAKMQIEHQMVLNEVQNITKDLGGKGPYVVLGFSANYALKVHEAVNIKFRREGSGAKFLESSLDRNEVDMLQVIAKEAKI